MRCLHSVYWLAVTVISIFRGYYAVTILVMGGKKLTFLSERKLPEDEWHHWSWWTHEIFINFAGSMIGWAAAYYLIFMRGKDGSMADAVKDGFLLLIAMAGIFGFLPWLLFKGDLRK